MPAGHKSLFQPQFMSKASFYLAISNNMITFAWRNNIMRMKTLRFLVIQLSQVEELKELKEFFA